MATASQVAVNLSVLHLRFAAVGFSESLLADKNAGFESERSREEKRDGETQTQPSSCRFQWVIYSC